MSTTLGRCRAEGFRYAALIPGSEELRRWYAGFGFAGDYPARFRTHDDFDFGTGDPAHDRAMICGSPHMIRDCCALLDARGFEVSPHIGAQGDYVIERAFVEK